MGKSTSDLQVMVTVGGPERRLRRRESPAVPNYSLVPRLLRTVKFSPYSFQVYNLTPAPSFQTYVLNPGLSKLFKKYYLFNFDFENYLF